MKRTKKLWIGLVVLTVLTPLGLILPDYFQAGAAWGEWGMVEIEKLVGYSPQGLVRWASWWHAPMPDYAFHGWENKGLGLHSLTYILSALLGVVVTVTIVWIIGKKLAKKDK